MTLKVRRPLPPYLLERLHAFLCARSWRDVDLVTWLGVSRLTVSVAMRGSPVPDTTLRKIWDGLDLWAKGEA